MLCIVQNSLTANTLGDTIKSMKNSVAIVDTRFGPFEVQLLSNRPDKGYTVTVPKLRGVVTHGDTVTESKEMAREAIELHCEGLFSQGQAEVRVLPKRKVFA